MIANVVSFSFFVSKDYRRTSHKDSVAMTWRSVECVTMASLTYNAPQFCCTSSNVDVQRSHFVGVPSGMTACSPE